MEDAILQPQLLSKEFIKPSRPTPETSRTLNLSLLDHFAPPVYVRIMFFYLNDSMDSPTGSVPNLQELKQSLAEALSYYYPFAGRIRADGCIECNNEGVEFFEALARCKLSDVLMEPRVEIMTHFCPVLGEDSLNGPVIDSLVLVQMTTFECGGIAITACFSHKIADACSIVTFMNDWASMNREPGVVLSPQFSGASLFPLMSQKPISSKPMSADENCSTRRFVFDASKIECLKTMAKSISNTLHPTRFQVLSALIYKLILSSSKSLGLQELAIVNVIVNIRKSMRQPMSECGIGNFALHNLIMVCEDEVELHTLVDLMKEGMDEFMETFKEEDTVYERSAKICKCYDQLDQLPSSNQGNMVLFSSWCRFPFYEVDFGFGKPVWVSNLPSPTKNCIFFSDTAKGDGVEAWATLEDQVMANFERDQELLAFAVPNRSPLEIFGGLDNS
ncbi:hypothetical protein Droror1_Dr00005861 [Drosera rotundifolia]